MQKWHVKALIQGVLSILPFSHRLNYLLQWYITKGIQDIESDITIKLRWCTEHLDYYRTVAQTESMPETALELGSGWIPAVPLGLFLCGVDRVYTIDINRLMTVTTLMDTIRVILKLDEINRLPEVLPSLRQDRLAVLQGVYANHKVAPMSIEVVLENCNITCIVGDARNSEFADDTFDLILSNATLEHISRPVLVAIFKEFRRILKSNGIMSHLIDMRDHYAYFDRGISELNYLRFSERQWRWVNSALHYQNRLRCSDYRQVHRETGFAIVEETHTTSAPDQLANVLLAAQFSHYDRDDLLVSSAWMIARPESLA